ncbi:MAG: M2 family metallopeptidase [Ignavibacteriaceae bacterium]|nr:M2 family metallopeptidase [Ignavibacteriaceae bacterium]
MTQELRNFIIKFEEKAAVAYSENALAYFNATISVKTEDYNKSSELQIKYNKIFSNKDDFALLKKIKESNSINDEPLKRQLDVLFRAYSKYQIDEKKLEEIVKLGTDIENRYSTFRAEVGGIKLTDNQIEEKLKNSTDSKILQETWLASKKIGNAVAKDILKLVKMRNETAKELGYSNYHEMSLKLSEQDPKEIDLIFDDLFERTKGVFAQVKNEMDEFLARRYKISKNELMPWHYQNRFFQEAPKIYAVDLDSYYKNEDVVELTKNYYNGIGLNIDDMLAKSDLYEKEGKYQHAYCTDIDRNGDVRVVCNVKPNYNWMNTMLHEYGHAVYSKYISRNLPWTLREEAHTFTTEAIAMLFGRFASNPQWLADVVGISKEEQEKIADASFKSLRLEQLVFSRWAQVVYRFEKSMYENPDQDLNKLWWDLVEKYQLLKRPENRNEPDWASKIHIALYPAYYHNYMLGELLASQLSFYINKNLLNSNDPMTESFKDNAMVGNYLKEKIFAVGNGLYWNEMIEKATGEKLTAKYYAEQFIR